MDYWKIPPVAKIYEALTAWADGRVIIVQEGLAEVLSSDGDRRYTVEWDDSRNAFRSDDNASFWQGYSGYPIVAVLMTLGRIHFDPASARLLSGVPWKQLNKRHRNRYNEAVGEVLEKIESSGGDRPAVERAAAGILEQLKTLRLQRLPRRTRP